MERQKSFDFGAILKNNQKKHKSKPSQFVSMAGGVKKRLETSLIHRKSSRFTIFDSIRNLSPLSRAESPIPITEAKQKIDHRRQQLEKWKEEKDKKKKEQASQKKKAFLVGVPKVHNPLKYVPPPPPKVMPSTSGRVTRSQTARTKKDVNESKPISMQSFAPKNAKFRAPEIKNLPKLPKLATVKAKTTMISFEPVSNFSQSEAKQTRSTRSRATKPSADLEPRITRSAVETRGNGKITKINSKPPTFYLQSSSSSEEQQSIDLTSPSSDDQTAKNLSSSSDNDTSKINSLKLNNSGSKLVTYNIQSSSETDSFKSLQSLSSTELENDKKSTSNKSRPSIIIISPTKKTPRKSLKQQGERRSSRVKQMSTPNKPVPKSESSSEERLRSPKGQDIVMTPQQIVEEAKKISPCVTMSRGKDNARKEMKKKLAEGLLDEDTCNNDDVDHFRKQLASEIKRMTEMCETWDKILEQGSLPDTVQEQILSAVGQARLLMSQKLQQFAKLVELCARPEPGAALVTPPDLQGFWDMVFMQVVNVDLRFKELEALKARDWVEVQPEQVKRKPVKVPKPAAKPKVAGPSRLRDMIAAARKAKKEEAPAAEQKVEEARTFEAGFFRVTSPVRAAPRTPRDRNVLLKAVLSSEANKSATKSSASFAMLRASVLGRGSVECEGVAPLPQTPLTQVNLHATPGRSILKQTNESTNKLNKSIKVVLFESDDPNSSIDQNTFDKKEPITTDSGLSSLDIEKDSTKNNRKPSLRSTDKESTKKTRSSLTRQEGFDTEYSPMKTRNRRKTLQTPQSEIATRSSRRSVVLQEVDGNVEMEKTPKRSARKKKVVDEAENVEEKTPKRSSRRRKSAPLSVL